MFLTRKHLSRRTVLRGVGASIALPLLEAMVPAQTPLRATAAVPRARLVCMEMVHGAAGSTEEGVKKHYWSPAKEGRDFEFSYALEPLEPLRDYVTIITGTDARQAEARAGTEGGADHFRSSAVFLTGAHAKQTAGPDVYNGTSIDQIYASAGHDTRLKSIELCIENYGLSGSCGFNYNCIYSETISWASPTSPLTMIVNPRVAFGTLFGTAPKAGSVLDGTAPERSRLGLGAADRARVDGYLEKVRSVERRIGAIEKHNAAAPDRELASAPLGVPDSWEQHVQLMFDLQVLALQADITRVTAFKMSRDTSNRVFPESGVTMPFHTLSHHVERPELIAEFAKLNRYHAGVATRFLEQLKNTPDGDGNLLDHSLVLYGSPMGDSNTHNHRNLPIVLVGHAGGKVQGNLHRVCAEGTPHTNTLLTILRRLGVEQQSIADSTGEIAI